MGQIYFLSDFHLGASNHDAESKKEIKLAKFLESIIDDCDELFLLGDIFDFWFEYYTVAPSGYYRFMGALAQFADKKIPIHYMVGNHDMWMRDLFTKEFNATMYYHPIVIERQGKKILVGHGDGIGPGDLKYKMLKKVFRFPLSKFLFQWIHPDIGNWIARKSSESSRHSQPDESYYYGNQREWIYQYGVEYIQKNDIDYMIFGHRHLPIYTHLENSNVIYVNLGDWIIYDTYATLNEGFLSLKQYQSDKSNSDFDPNL